MVLGLAFPAGAPLFAAAGDDALSATPQLPGVQLGQRLPEEALQLELVELSERRVPLSDLLGEQGTLVVFTANTCPYSIDWLDRFPRLATFSRQHDISFLLINSNARKRSDEDSPEAMRALAQEHGFDFPYLLDEKSKLADTLGATRTPEVFLFDRALRLVYRGAIDDYSGPFERVTEHWTTEALGQMAAGEEVTTSNTPALGCSVLRPRRRRP